MPIVYMATNSVNGHFYIGVTKQTLHKRKGEHRRDAAGGKKTCRAFHAAIRKYGWDSFVWEVVSDHATLDELMVEETRLIRELKPHYNISSGGYGANIRAMEGQAELSLMQKPVRCVDDGRVFKSMSEAAFAYGVRMSLVSGALHRGGRCRGRKFEFLDSAHIVERRHLLLKVPRGVIFRADKKTNQWQARVWVHSSARTIGFYATPEAAHAAHLAEQDRLGVYDLPKKGNKSGYRGVAPHSNGGWQATLRIGDKRCYLGAFPTPEAANEAIVQARGGAAPDVRRQSISRPNRGGSAPLKGVEKLVSGRWRSKHAARHLGVFDTPEEAHQAYLAARGVPGGV